ncbi:MAG TPA: hypothetical protein VJ801_08170, partial [Polyangia bacterium]|nr:hypothetical protein [Polyangia bacterium]
MQFLAANMRMRKSARLVLAASLFGLAVGAGGCFRSPMRHASGCSDADPNCQTGTIKTRDAGLPDGASSGLRDGAVGGTGGGAVGG